MPVLPSPRQERFAQELAKGKTQIEAYSIAGYRGDETAACRLSKNVKVSARVAELLNRGAERAECTIASILTELEEARALALKLDQPAPAVSASMGKAKVSGILVERNEHSGPNGGPIEVSEITDEQRIKALAVFWAKHPPKA